MFLHGGDRKLPREFLKPDLINTHSLHSPCAVTPVWFDTACFETLQTRNTFPKCFYSGRHLIKVHCNIQRINWFYQIGIKQGPLFPFPTRIVRRGHKDPQRSNNPKVPKFCEAHSDLFSTCQSILPFYFSHKTENKPPLKRSDTIPDMSRILVMRDKKRVLSGIVVGVRCVDKKRPPNTQSTCQSRVYWFCHFVFVLRMRRIVGPGAVRPGWTGRSQLQDGAGHGAQHPQRRSVSLRQYRRVRLNSNFTHTLPYLSGCLSVHPPCPPGATILNFHTPCPGNWQTWPPPWSNVAAPKKSDHMISKARHNASSILAFWTWRPFHTEEPFQQKMWSPLKNMNSYVSWYPVCWNNKAKTITCTGASKNKQLVLPAILCVWHTANKDKGLIAGIINAELGGGGIIWTGGINRQNTISGCTL